MRQPRMFPNINYDARFMEFFNSYPKRPGTMRKSEAYKIWQQALTAGVEGQEIIDGAKRYKLYCDKEGMTGTNYVMQPATFISELEYENDFMTEQELKESEWDRACRLCKERGLDPFRGSPFETPEQFIERVNLVNNLDRNVVSFK